MNTFVWSISIAIIFLLVVLYFLLSICILYIRYFFQKYRLRLNFEKLRASPRKLTRILLDDVLSLFTIFNFGFFLLTISILISIMGYLHQNESFNWNNLITDFYANVGTELGSLSLTILVVDYLYKRQSKEELKQSLIREMSSTDNGIALRAVKELKANGWLQDGSLQDIRLEGANLKDADLTDADLSGVRFFDTNLSYANLANAILKDGIMINTNLSGANLAKSNLMNLNQGSIWVSRSYQNLDKRRQKGFAPFANIMDKLEESQINW